MFYRKTLKLYTNFTYILPLDPTGGLSSPRPSGPLPPAMRTPSIVKSWVCLCPKVEQFYEL